tara:strand:- start:1691 stop:3100 length:1410 start_codon:yes stop_codon:yes gene_type:complete
MKKLNNYDVIVIGGGPGGYVAAIRAAQLGLKTACIEKEHLGGICLNWGCIPTKAILRSSEVFHLIKNSEKFGITTSDINFDIEKIVKRSRAVADKLSKGVTYLLKKYKVEVILGHGKINGPNNVVVDCSDKKQIELIGKNIIIATGASSKNLPNIKSDSEFIWNYKDALMPAKLPKSLLIIGSGAIGIEFASFFNTFGTKVTIVEILDRVLPVEDKEISEFAEKKFLKQGMKIIKESSVQIINKQDSLIEVQIESKNKKSSNEKFEKIILAVGIEANSENIGLQTVSKVKTDKGNIVVNEWCETGQEGVFAIGDVAGTPWLAHKAMHEAVLCIEKIANLKNLHPINKNNIPSCTYCYPQIASVGITEEEAKSQGISYKIGRFQFSANGKAIALGEEEGFIKTIFNSDNGELLGAHMIGSEVTELIQGYTIAKNIETTELELMQTVFPHPTLSEMMHESVLDAFDKALHK